jgi:hypothetical protein
MMRSDLPKLDPAFVEHVMSEYLKGMLDHCFPIFHLYQARLDTVTTR